MKSTSPSQSGASSQHLPDAYNSRSAELALYYHELENRGEIAHERQTWDRKREGVAVTAVGNKAILDSVKFLHIVMMTLLNEIIRSYGDIDADETFGTEGCEGDVSTERS